MEFWKLNIELYDDGGIECIHVYDDQKLWTAVFVSGMAADVEPGRTLEITAKVTGLACAELCLPVETAASLKLPITAEPGESANEKLFQVAREALAPAIAEAPYIKGSKLSVSKEKIGIDEPAELVGVIRVEKASADGDFDSGSTSSFSMTCSNGTGVSVSVDWTRTATTIEYTVFITYVSGSGGGTIPAIAAANTR